MQKRMDDIILNGHPSNRLPNNINVSVRYLQAQPTLLNLDMEGICVSTGSACSSGDMEASHVLLAAGCPPEQARGSVRFSMGKWTTRAEIDRVLEVMPPIVKKLRAMSPLANRP
jgi:cysteine desulfurase